MITYMVKFVSSLSALAILLCYGSCVLASESSAVTFPGEQRAAFLREVLDPSSEASTGNQGKPALLCRPKGQIHDACADYESVEMVNDAFMFRKLDELRKTKYFRYFLVDLYKDCPFWVDDGLCMNRACAVERLNETDVPEEFRALKLSEVRQSEKDSEEGYAQSKNDIDFCHLDDEDASPDAIYVDLLQNPERFTGYAGVSANRVWRSIYEENCFGGIQFTEPPRSASSGGTGFISMKHLKSGKALPITMLTPNDAASHRSGGLTNLIDSMQAPMDAGNMEQCLEKRVFYRVISGLHASISIHICNEYLDPETKLWKPNLECFMTRISQHPERLQNVYFDYVLMMRALSKAGEYLDKFALREGDEIRDPHTRSQLQELLKSAGANRPSFDEHQLFATNNDPTHNMQIAELKEDFRAQFLNISRIMDCVGCDKCRLWGKLQITGIGTALKLLFAFEEDKPEQHLSLRRSELVALINTAYRISESIQAVEGFRELYRQSLYGENEPGRTPPASGQRERSFPPSFVKRIWLKLQPTFHAMYKALHTITTDTLNTLAIFVDQGDPLVPEDQLDTEL
ncbi:endoplasmic oxidoreductin-1 [Malassezia yamatoensis]|uniref:Endoplasmic oxidoreductin-1 n=1 Tax=Malassezia yamatoensis TaxID=253288 RepID=A0AAJ5YTV2_9BASI|nr:endoplasmic oxidoreductin-1 [Malassezia yamatoensis]